MKFFILLIFYFIFIETAFSVEPIAEVVLVSPPAVLKEGDIVEGSMKVWPLENADVNEFKKIENTTLANALYISEVSNVETSPNNADVVEVKLLFIVKRSTELEPQVFNYRGRSIPIKLPDLNLAPAEKDSPGYFVMDQGLIYSHWGKILTGILALILMTLIIFKRNAIKNILNKFKHDPIEEAKKQFKIIFANASKREDFETIYIRRQEWLGLNSELARLYEEFFKVLHKHQYKKDWNPEDLNEVKESFEAIRRSFK